MRGVMKKWRSQRRKRNKGSTEEEKRKKIKKNHWGREKNI